MKKILVDKGDGRIYQREVDNITTEIKIKKCPSCNNIQPWDVLYGYADKFCPENCKSVPFPFGVE